MEKRPILLLTLTFGLLFLVFACTWPHGTVEAKTKIPEPKIGLIDLPRIKKVVPHFIALEQRAKNNRLLLEEFTAQVLTEHQQQIRALSPEDYDRSRELAVATQADRPEKAGIRGKLPTGRRGRPGGVGSSGGPCCEEEEVRLYSPERRFTGWRGRCNRSSHQNLGQVGVDLLAAG